MLSHYILSVDSRGPRPTRPGRPCSVKVLGNGAGPDADPGPGLQRSVELAVARPASRMGVGRRGAAAYPCRRGGTRQGVRGWAAQVRMRAASGARNSWRTGPRNSAQGCPLGGGLPEDVVGRAPRGDRGDHGRRGRLMAAVDAASLRAELDDCRARIEAIERNGGASADTLVPVHARFLPLDIPVAVFLEQRCRRPRATPACRARVVMPTTTGPARPRSGHRRPDDARSEGPRGGVTPRDMDPGLAARSLSAPPLDGLRLPARVLEVALGVLHPVAQLERVDAGVGGAARGGAGAAEQVILAVRRDLDVRACEIGG